MVRCSCGVLMGTHTVRADASKGQTYYYFCQTRRTRTRPCEQKMIRADKLEPAVGELVSGLLKDPQKRAAGMDRLIEQESTWRANGPDRESEILLGKVSECVRLRAAYQDQQASGLMTMDELADKLEELERAKALAQAELANLSVRRRKVEELVRDKEAVLALRSEIVVTGLDDTSPRRKSRRSTGCSSWR